ncbi:hypothetical protein [Vibrio sp. M260118]
MKRFFPSSVMLIPFVVKHYEDEESDETSELNKEAEQHSELEPET